MRRQKGGLMYVSPSFAIPSQRSKAGEQKMTIQESADTVRPAYPDVFEELRDALGCCYISDLRFPAYLGAARETISGFDLSRYPLSALSDMAEYLYGRKLCFDTREDARHFFAGR